MDKEVQIIYGCILSKSINNMWSFKSQIYYPTKDFIKQNREEYDKDFITQKKSFLKKIERDKKYNLFNYEFFSFTDKKEYNKMYSYISKWVKKENLKTITND